MDTQTEAQRAYYARTAEHYEAMHVNDDDEHGIALASFAGLAALFGARSVLDVGAGTGRAVAKLNAALPGARIVGVEPVAALRQVGHAQGIAEDQLIDGDALALPFADDSFDFVIETGVLHHIANPAEAVSEMIRVARIGVLLSDSNNYGQGSPIARRIKGTIARLGLWRTWIRLSTKGKMARWSEGDGVFYSYSVFNDIALVARKFPRQFVMNTVPLKGTDLKRDAAHVSLFAVKR
jgi:ubiquinone/menaquinone biosynthesis C-methylase UbiE